MFPFKVVGAILGHDGMVSICYFGRMQYGLFVFPFASWFCVRASFDGVMQSRASFVQQSKGDAVMGGIVVEDGFLNDEIALEIFKPPSLRLPFP